MRRTFLAPHYALRRLADRAGRDVTTSWLMHQDSARMRRPDATVRTGLVKLTEPCRLAVSH